MLFPSRSLRHHSQRWLTLLSILCVHGAVLWLFRPIGHQQQSANVQYLSVIHTPMVHKAKDLEAKPPAIQRKAHLLRQATSETVLNSPKPEVAVAVPTIENTNANTSLNLDMLRAQAVQIERNRAKSDIEKMNEEKKLNRSLEATFDKEVNRVELPECRALLLGKHMPERMMIIQDHSKKKFCRSSM